MNSYRRNTGRYGEELAVKYLISRGFRILDKNYRTPFGEIDIVAEQGEYIVFVEVKTRSSEKYGSPLSAINIEKQKNVIRNCQYYLLKQNMSEAPCRIDAIGINITKTGALKVLKHVKNAFGIDF